MQRRPDFTPEVIQAARLPVKAATVEVAVSSLLAIRDALITEDYHEAYHQLRLIADPDCEHALAERNHWIEWEHMASTR